MEKVEDMSGKWLRGKEELLWMVWRIEKRKDRIIEMLGLWKESYGEMKFGGLKKLKGDSWLKVFCEKME